MPFFCKILTRQLVMPIIKIVQTTFIVCALYQLHGRKYPTYSTYSRYFINFWQFIVILSRVVTNYWNWTLCKFDIFKLKTWQKYWWIELVIITRLFKYFVCSCSIFHIVDIIYWLLWNLILLMNSEHRVFI